MATTESVSAHEVVQSAWLSAASECCRQVCSQLAECDRTDADRLLRSFTQTLPLPSGPAEQVVLRGLLLGVAVRASAILHGRLHADPQARCSLPSERLLEGLAGDPLDASISAFESWQRAFLAALDQVHPPTLGSSIGVLVRRDFRRRWSLTALARHFKTSPGQIRKSFGRKFGRSVHDYQRLARIVAALDEVQSSKIDAIALNVGYQSKKNFYTAFRRLIGRTPIQYRQLPNEEASLLKELARQQLTRRLRSPKD